MEVYQINGYTHILNSFKKYSSGLEQILGMLKHIDIQETPVTVPNEHFSVDDLDFPDLGIHNSSVNNPDMNK